MRYFKLNWLKLLAVGAPQPSFCAVDMRGVDSQSILQALMALNDSKITLETIPPLLASFHNLSFAGPNDVLFTQDTANVKTLYALMAKHSLPKDLLATVLNALPEADQTEVLATHSQSSQLFSWAPLILGVTVVGAGLGYLLGRVFSADTSSNALAPSILTETSSSDPLVYLVRRDDGESSTDSPLACVVPAIDPSCSALVIGGNTDNPIRVVDSQLHQFLGNVFATLTEVQLGSVNSTIEACAQGYGFADLTVEEVKGQLLSSDSGSELTAFRRHVINSALPYVSVDSCLGFVADLHTQSLSLSSLPANYCAPDQKFYLTSRGNPASQSFLTGFEGVHEYLNSLTSHSPLDQASVMDLVTSMMFAPTADQGLISARNAFKTYLNDSHQGSMPGDLQGFLALLKTHETAQIAAMGDAPSLPLLSLGLASRLDTAASAPVGANTQCKIVPYGLVVVGSDGCEVGSLSQCATGDGAYKILVAGPNNSLVKVDLTEATSLAEKVCSADNDAHRAELVQELFSACSNAVNASTPSTVPTSPSTVISTPTSPSDVDCDETLAHLNMNLTSLGVGTTYQDRVALIWNSMTDQAKYQLIQAVKNDIATEPLRSTLAQVDSLDKVKNLPIDAVLQMFTAINASGCLPDALIPFLYPTTPPPVTPDGPDKGGKTDGGLIGGILGGVVALLLVVAIVVCRARRHKGVTPIIVPNNVELQPMHPQLVSWDKFVDSVQGVFRREMQSFGARNSHFYVKFSKAQSNAILCTTAGVSESISDQFQIFLSKGEQASEAQITYEALVRYADAKLALIPGRDTPLSYYHAIQTVTYGELFTHLESSASDRSERKLFVQGTTGRVVEITQCDLQALSTVLFVQQSSKPEADHSLMLALTQASTPFSRFRDKVNALTQDPRGNPFAACFDMARFTAQTVWVGSTSGASSSDAPTVTFEMLADDLIGELTYMGRTLTSNTVHEVGMGVDTIRRLTPLIMKMITFFNETHDLPLKARAYLTELINREIFVEGVQTDFLNVLDRFLKYFTDCSDARRPVISGLIKLIKPLSPQGIWDLIRQNGGNSTYDVDAIFQSRNPASAISLFTLPRPPLRASTDSGSEFGFDVDPDGLPAVDPAADGYISVEGSPARSAFGYPADEESFGFDVASAQSLGTDVTVSMILDLVGDNQLTTIAALRHLQNLPNKQVLSDDDKPRLQDLLAHHRSENTTLGATIFRNNLRKEYGLDGQESLPAAQPSSPVVAEAEVVTLAILKGSHDGDLVAVLNQIASPAILRWAKNKANADVLVNDKERQIVPAKFLSSYLDDTPAEDIRAVLIAEKYVKEEEVFGFGES